MQTTNIQLQRSSLTTIIDSFATKPAKFSELLQVLNPAGYATQAAISETFSAQSDTKDAIGTIDPFKSLDLSLAGGFMTLSVSLLSAEIFEPVVHHHSADDATTLLIMLLAALAFDRYAASAKTWKRIQSGVNRLLVDDPVRSAHVDAAYFLAAYLLGLPWMCYQPNPKRICEWLKDRPEDDLKRVLLWLMSGVAAEVELDGMLIESNLQVSQRILRSFDKTVRFRERQQLLRSAITRAQALLSSHKALHSRLADNMLQGASVGECVALVTDSYST